MLFADRYQILSELGRGGAARVMRARDQRLDREVALKLFEGDGPVSEGDRFLDEAQALADLRHPHVVQLLDYGVVEGQRYLVLEYLEGGTLAPLCGQLPEARALRLASQVLTALEAGHQHGVLHRDVKPGNVMLDSGGDARLTDFGLALFSGRRVRTRTGILLGTPEYMAPELFRGEPASEASDLFAWGCLLHALLRGESPVQGSIGEIGRDMIQGRWRPPRLPGPVGQVLAGVLDPDPARRMGAPEVHEVLAGPPTLRQGFRGPEPTGAARAPATVVLASSPAPATPPPPGRRLPLRAGAGLLLLLAGGLWWSRGGRPQPPAPTPAAAATTAAAQLAEDWQHRVAAMELEAWLRSTHDDALQRLPARLRGLETYLDPMWEQRTRGSVPALAAFLEEARAALPHRPELTRDRAAMAAALGDRDLDLEVRWRLYQALQQLEEVDCYLQAWGAAPVYQVGELMDRLVQIRDLDLEAAPPSPPDPPPGPAPPGTYRVHRWPEQWTSLKYVLVPDPEHPNAKEQLAWTVAAMDPQEHGQIFGEIELGPDPARLGALHLEMTLANLLPPNRLQVRWNGFELLYRAPVARIPSIAWRLEAFPDHRVRLSLPPAMARPGRNTLKVSTGPPPGLEHTLGINLDRVLVTLEP